MDKITTKDLKIGGYKYLCTHTYNCDCTEIWGKFTGYQDDVSYYFVDPDTLEVTSGSTILGGRLEFLALIYDKLVGDINKTASFYIKKESINGKQ